MRYLAMQKYTYVVCKVKYLEDLNEDFRSVPIFSIVFA